MADDSGAVLSPPAVPRVVAAVNPGAQQRIRAILPPCELRFVETEAELLRALDQGRCDMLIVEAQFDESTAVASLERVRSRGETFPVICVRGVPSTLGLGQPALDALRLASNALGAHHFVDLLDHPDDEIGNARVRAVFQRLLPCRKTASL